MQATLLVSVLLVHDIFAIILDCDFKFQTSHWGVEYACVPSSLRTTLYDRNVTEVKGVHDAGQSNQKVIKLFVKKQSCPYLPLNLGSHFGNLKTLYMMHSKVQHLLNGDLDGLKNLRVFDVSHNPIEMLGQDFFKGHDTIEIISFYDCHLKMIHPNSLNPLTNLKEAHFEQNVCIDAQGNEHNQISDIKTEIADKCQSQFYETIINRVDEQKGTSETLSFTRRNANLIISFLLVLLFVVTAILALIFRRTFNSWSELRNTLI